MIEATLTVYEPALKKTFTNVKEFKNADDAKLFAMAMNWKLVGTRAL